MGVEGGVKEGGREVEMGMNEWLLSEGRVIGWRVVGSGKGLVRGEKLVFE